MVSCSSIPKLQQRRVIDDSVPVFDWLPDDLSPEDQALIAWTILPYTLFRRSFPEDVVQTRSLTLYPQDSFLSPLINVDGVDLDYRYACFEH